MENEVELQTLEISQNLPQVISDPENDDVPQSSLNDISFSEILWGVSKNKSLTTLIFKDNYISSASMKIMNVILRYSKVLNSIDLSHNPIGDRGVHLLFSKTARNQNIMDIRLVGVGMSDIGAREIAKYLSKAYLKT